MRRRAQLAASLARESDVNRTRRSRCAVGPLNGKEQNGAYGQGGAPFTSLKLRSPCCSGETNCRHRCGICLSR